MEKIKLLSIVGPTATGKTKLSVDLAREFGGEIISGDSIQVYEQFNILSAKPTEAELSAVKHHLVGFLSVEEVYSVAEFKTMAAKCIEEITRKGKLPILVGGTGLYIDSLIKNISFDSPKKHLKVDLPDDPQEMKNLLYKVDPESAEKIHVNNVKRLKRALEFYYSVGYPISKQVEQSKVVESPYDVCKIGLSFKNRETLYSKINLRVDEMIKSGLLEEVRNVSKDKKVSKTAVSAIGYKELVDFLNSKVTLEQAFENIKLHSRQYAKRQLTWFRRDEKINWIYIDDYEDFSKVIDEANEITEKFLFGE